MQIAEYRDILIRLIAITVIGVLMKEGNTVDNALVTRVVRELILKAETELPPDAINAIKVAYEKESGSISRIQLKTIIDNFTMAGKRKMPMCQDTGLMLFYLTLGNFSVDNLYDAVVEGTKEATKSIPLRPNAVHPLTRENNNNNTGRLSPVIHIELDNKPYMELTVFPKGAGSENMSSLAMLTPSDGVNGIKKFVIDTVKKAGGKPCPPVIVGVGIGGSADISMSLAKKSLMRRIGTHNDDKAVSELEESILKEVNSLHIGAMGLGGDTTALAVHIEYAYCHTASLPVAVNLQCWAARKATARIYENGKVEYTG